MNDSNLPGPIACVFATVFCVCAARVLHKKGANDFYVFLSAMAGALFFMCTLAGGLHDKLLCWFVAALFLAVAAQFMVKEKIPYAFSCLMVGAFFFCCGLTWVQIFLERSLTQTVNTHLDDFAATIEQQRVELLGLGRTNANQRVELLALVRTNAMQSQTNADTQRLLQGYAETNRDTLAQLKQQETANETLQQTLAEQERKLTNVDMVLNSLFAQTIVERFDGTDTNRVCILDKGGPGKLVVFKLTDSPFIGSIHGIFNYPNGIQAPMYPGIGCNHNVITMYFSAPVDMVKGAKFTIEYVKNIVDTNRYEKIDIREDKIYVDDLMLNAP
jgi:hypothetical protein